MSGLLVRQSLRAHGSLCQRANVDRHEKTCRALQNEICVVILASTVFQPDGSGRCTRPSPIQTYIHYISRSYTRTPGHRDTEPTKSTPGHRDTGRQYFKTQLHRDTGTPGHRTYEKYTGTQTQLHRDTGTPDLRKVHRDTGTPGHREARFQNAVTPGHRDTGTPNLRKVHRDTGTPGGKILKRSYTGTPAHREAPYLRNKSPSCNVGSPRCEGGGFKTTWRSLNTQQDAQALGRRIVDQPQ